MSNIVNNYTETDLGNISLNPRGEYDDSAAYEYLDTVSYRGGSYFCLAELETTITGIAPDAGRDSEHWQMIAAPGDMTPEYTAAYNNVINKAVQVEASRAAVELAQQEIEAVQTDVQQLHSDTVQTAQEAENSKNSAADSAQSAEQSRKTASESEQNINGQIAGFDSRVSEAVEQSKEEINTTKQQAINTITNQQTTSVNTVKTEGEKIITRVGNDAKTVADDRVTVEEAAQTVLNNAQEVARNAQTVASNTEKAAASAEGAKTSADNAAQSAKSVEDASKQIEQNKKDVDSLKEDLTSKADKTSLVKTDRKLDALWKLNQGISYEFQTDNAEAYQKTVPSGAKMVSIKSIGGKLTSDDTKKQMSAPVNEVVEQGKNLFDFSRLVSDGVNVMDYEKQTITVPARTNNTGYNQTLRDLCPGITPGTYVFSMKRSNPNSGNGSYFLEAAKDFSVNTPVELTDELLDNHIAWYNNPDSNIENVISEIQIEKNSTETLYSQYYQKSHKIPQAILNLDGYGESGNFVDFVEKKYHKGDRTIDISDIIGDTFQEPFEVEAGGTLTFKNSHSVPVPSSEEYVISLAEVAK